MTDKKPAPGRKWSAASHNKFKHAALVVVQTDWFFSGRNTAEIERLRRVDGAKGKKGVLKLSSETRHFYHGMALRVLRFELAIAVVRALWKVNKQAAREMLSVQSDFDVGAASNDDLARRLAAQHLAESDRNKSTDEEPVPFLLLGWMSGALEDVETPEARRLLRCVIWAARFDPPSTRDLLYEDGAGALLNDNKHNPFHLTAKEVASNLASFKGDFQASEGDWDARHFYLAEDVRISTP